MTETNAVETLQYTIADSRYGVSHYSSVYSGGSTVVAVSTASVLGSNYSGAAAVDSYCIDVVLRI